MEKIAYELAENQLVAYNARAIDDFLKPYADSIKVYTYPNEFQYKGKDKMREMYGSFFKANPKLHCELVSRTVFGNLVIDKEKVTGFANDEARLLEAIAIYTVENGKITEVRFMRKK